MIRNNLIFIFLLFFSGLQAQELLCNVIINDDQVQTTEKQIFADMKNGFANFLNNRKWTNETFKQEEKIACNLLITLDKSSVLGNYKATVQIQSVRPVYGTAYESQVFNFIDKSWQFEYVQFQPIEFIENSSTSNLTAMLAFYAYVIIGLDYDSFSKHGGSPYFQKALNIVNNAVQSGGGGWEAFSDQRSRGALMDNLISQQMLPVREAYYIYHRQGMDRFASNPDEARLKVLDALEKIQAVHAQRPVSVLINTFFDAKAEELAHIFSQGDQALRQKAHAIVTKIDPTQSAKYQKMIDR